MTKTLAGIALFLFGASLALAGLFYCWMSGFASPAVRDLVIALSVGGMVLGTGAMLSGVALWRRARRGPSNEA